MRYESECEKKKAGTFEFLSQRNLSVLCASAVINGSKSKTAETQRAQR
jgi:hypothetical protein